MYSDTKTMKDYYYILGVGREATEAEIKLAYKKLSIKFHPDKNQGDTFFEDRFKEVQEAYEVLSNPLKRANYNAQLEPRMAREHLKSIDTNPPMITVFESTKKSIREGDPITLRWTTVHANEVEIDYLGKVTTSGTKTIRLPMIYNKEKIIIGLIARNTFINQQIKKKIIIKNKSFDDRKVQLLYGDGDLREEEMQEHPQTETNLYEASKEDTEIKETLREHPKTNFQKEGSSTSTDSEKISIKKEKTARLPTKEERLDGIKAIIAENEEGENPGFQISDIYIYIVVVVLLIFITIMSIFVYQMNPL